jgi:hypothetical protein
MSGRKLGSIVVGGSKLLLAILDSKCMLKFAA